MWNYNESYDSNELYHYGVLGMKWGHRKDKYRSDGLGNGHHARAARRIQRDADNLRKHGYFTEAKAVQKVSDKHRIKAKSEKKQFKKDLKQYRNDKKTVDINVYDNGLMTVKSRGDLTINRIKVEKGEKYVKRIIDADKRRNRMRGVATLAGSAAFLAGASYLGSTYNIR